MLAVLFISNKNTVRAAKRRIQLFMLMRDPLGSLPTFLNSDAMTEQQVLCSVFMYYKSFLCIYT